MFIIQSANLALRFLLELCLLAALANWGFQAGSGWLAKIGLGLGAPLLAAVIWGIFISPKADVPLPVAWWLLVQVSTVPLPDTASGRMSRPRQWRHASICG